MHKAIEADAALNFLIIGLSHVLQHAAWAEFFGILRRLGRPGAFLNGFLSISMGTLIVSFHNVWTGIPVVLTLIGWAMVVKSLIIFVNPEGNLRSMEMVKPEHSRRFIPAGLVMVGIALVLAVGLWTA